MEIQTTVDLSEFFKYAEKFGLSWNPANQLFIHDTELINFNSYTPFDFEEGFEELDQINSFMECKTPMEKGVWIIREFMIEFKLQSMLILA